LVGLITVAWLGLIMARYTCLVKVATSLDRFRHSLDELLRSCNCDVIYDTDDYVVAREVPGGVAYAKLVTVEVLIDKPSDQPFALGEEVCLNFVVKNEELPLQTDNHCWRMFSLVNQAVTESHQWHLLERIAG
jgi:hypothetical protein